MYRRKGMVSMHLRINILYLTRIVTGRRKDYVNIKVVSNEDEATVDRIAVTDIKCLLFYCKFPLVLVY